MQSAFYTRTGIGVIIALALLACRPGEPTDPALKDQAAPAARPNAPAPSLSLESIAGPWRIVTIDNAPPAALPGAVSRERTPRLHFTPAGYGGTAGCNYFGGLGLLEGDRYYAAPGGQTAMGCGDLTAQEMVVTGIFWSAPRVALGADGTLSLKGDKHSVELRRDPTLPGEDSPPASAAPPLRLAGSAWIIRTVDGKLVEGPSDAGRRTLRLEAASWSGTAACATLGGEWRQQLDRLILSGPISTTEQKCPPEAAEMDSRLAALLSANPRFITGPNGEILIAGGGHWLIGDRMVR
jgi:heat shock protein HslJ